MEFEPMQQIDSDIMGEQPSDQKCLYCLYHSVGMFLSSISESLDLMALYN